MKPADNIIDPSFITNEPGRILRDRLDKLLNSTQQFDCLVGYFYISGFYRLYPALKNIRKIRILVGLQTDHRTYSLIAQAKERGELPLQSHATTKEQVEKTLLKELEKSPDRLEVEEGIRTFIEWIRSGKLEIKAHPAQNLHAKVYIMTFAEGDRDLGRVITGSSNLTQAGLQENLEFNVELKNPADYLFARNKFNELWESAVDISEPYRDTVENKSHLANFTPYELYLKFLYEYFETELSRPPHLEDMYVPADFKKLQYQEEAVLNARKILEEYGGVFLSDVVGLGKTFMAALLAQQLDGRHLVIAPPHLLDKNQRGSWPIIFGDFQVRQTDFESVGKLDDLLRRDTSKYTNVFIDESHRFRTETSQRYEMLAQICRGKRVILVSATPLNNTPLDILSQVKLFQAGKASNIPNLRNLEAFFRGLQARLKGLDRQHDREKYFNIVQANAKETREKVLKYLMVRRTRNEIETYYGEDMRRQGLQFPEIADPEPLFYQFNFQENKIFDYTLQLITTEFTYSRYTPLLYYEGELDTRERQGQRNLASFMKTLLVKRLESSFYAFRLTLERFIQSYARVIAEFRNGTVYISKKHAGKIFDLLEQGDLAGIDRLIEQDKAERLDAADFTDDFLRDLERDHQTLCHIQAMWKEVQRDPKWLTFKETLQTTSHLRTGKLIIFTESQETADYLAGRIRDEVEAKTLLYYANSGEAEHRRVIQNFDANAYNPSDDFRILVCTEVLAEGINLHRSNAVINYDIPWNPTRLIQRVGRVNRVDTSFENIYTYNFFPTEEANTNIKLREAAEAKIHAFIEMLGSDARLLTEGEEIKSHDLFSKLTSKKLLTGEEDDEESELEYLAEIRHVRDTQPTLFERIKRLPKKARSTRMVSDAGAALPALLTYFRQGRLDKFFLAHQGESDAVELDFLATVKWLRPSTPDEPRQSIPPAFYQLLEQNRDAFAAATQTEDADLLPSHRGQSNDAYILRRLRAAEIFRCPTYTEENERYIRQVIRLLEDGALPKPTTKKVAEALKREMDPLRVLGLLQRDISPLYFQPTRAQQMRQAWMPREVILSSWIVATAEASQ